MAEAAEVVAGVVLQDRLACLGSGADARDRHLAGTDAEGIYYFEFDFDPCLVVGSDVVVVAVLDLAEMVIKRRVHEPQTILPPQNHHHTNSVTHSTTTKNQHISL